MKHIELQFARQITFDNGLIAYAHNSKTGHSYIVGTYHHNDSEENIKSKAQKAFDIMVKHPSENFKNFIKG